MTWFRVDDQFHSHPKVIGLPAPALALWLLAGSWSACHRTSGYVPSSALASFLGDDGADAAAALVRCGLWRRAVAGYEFHDWAVYNETALSLVGREESRKASRALHRRPEVLAAIRDRDGAQCQRCRALVGWADKRSDRGGTYVVLDPAAGITVANVAVSCRGCSRQPWGQTVDKPGDSQGATVPESPETGTRSVPREANQGQVAEQVQDKSARPADFPPAVPRTETRSSHRAQPPIRNQFTSDSDSTPTCPPGSLSLSTSSRSSSDLNHQDARELHAADPPPAEFDDRYGLPASGRDRQERAQ